MTQESEHAGPLFSVGTLIVRLLSQESIKTRVLYRQQDQRPTRGRPRLVTPTHVSMVQPSGHDDHGHCTVPWCTRPTILQPSVTSLGRAANPVSRAIVEPRHAVKSVVDKLRREPHHRGSTRVPCDIVRENVSMAPWRPYASRTESVGTAGGLVQLLYIIRHTWQHW